MNNSNVYTLLPVTPVPTRHNVICGGYVYRVKADTSHKGRVVALEWVQFPGIGYGSMVAPVCRLQRVRVVLAMAAECNMQCWQLAYTTAFLNADLAEEVYAKMRPGYQEFDATGVPLAMRRFKNIYGLRQSPNNWWNTIDELLVEICLKSLNPVSCVYTYV